MAKKKKKKAAAAPATAGVFSPAAFREADEESMAAFPTSSPSATVVDEQTQRAAMAPTPEPTGAERAAKTIEARKTAFQEELAAREASKPTEDPGPGNSWVFNVRENKWKIVRTGSGGEQYTFSPDGTLLFQGKPFTGQYAGNTFVNGKITDFQNPKVTDDKGTVDQVTTYTAPDGRIFTDLNAYNAYINDLAKEDKRRQGQSAYNILFDQFNQFGLGALIAPLQSFITEGLSPEEFTIRLRETDAYKKRFAANQQRIARGLRALSEAEYITLEDQYQDVMRRYGLPQSFYARGEMGRQEGFEKFIGGDVSPVELEDRIQTAQNRVTNAPAQVRDALSQFYGAELGNGDILAFVLDPDKALPEIKRKVTAAEIGAGAAMAGLGAGRARAEELGRFGVTGEQARQGFATIAEFLPTAQKLGDIYGKQGMGPFTQATAEQEVFGLAGAAEAQRQRRKLTELETAAFSGQAGVAGGALARERAGAI